MPLAPQRSRVLAAVAIPAILFGSLTLAAPATAAPIAPLTASAMATKPMAATKPTISGTAVSGATLTAKAGTWTRGAKLTYVWKANGVTLAGITASTYKVSTGSAGKAITVTVTGTLAGYTKTSLTSSATLKVGRVGTVAVSGKAVVGTKLTAATANWTPGVALAYQWKRGGASISGATASTYTAGAADVAKTLSVTVTAKKTGFATVTATSKATASVVRGTSSAPLSNGSCPSWAPIKGNIPTSKNDDKIYHVPGSRYYAKTIPEVCFATEGAARAAGFRAPKN